MNILEHEEALWGEYPLIAGLDEAGRGAWAGPVVAAAVIFEPGVILSGVTDSKKLTPQRRDVLFDEIQQKALAFGVGLIGPDIIDDVNILEATKLAMIQALKALNPQPQYLLVDGKMTLDVSTKQKWIIEGDSKSHSIAAASILAKVTRDRFMMRLADKYPQYAFEKHKGYGTKAHQEALRTHGVLKLHRCSYKPVAKLISG